MSSFHSYGIIALFGFISFLNADCFDEFVAIYEKFGTEQYMMDEEITQKNHVLQAAYLAHTAGAPEEVTIGLLFHDIGRLIEKEKIEEVELMDEIHDDLGREWLLERGFPEITSNLVKYHTLAKVILCRESPDYYDHLSEASKKSYHIQKVKYENNQEEWKAFQELTYRDMILTARKCDDMAKIVGIEADKGHIPYFPFYKPIVERVLAGKGLPATKSDWQSRIDVLHAEMCADRQSFENRMRNHLTGFKRRLDDKGLPFFQAPL